MWTGFLAFFNGLLEVTNKLLAAWSVSQERQAGRDQVHLEDSQRTINDLEKAHEIDVQGPPPDHSKLLDELQAGPPK